MNLFLLSIEERVGGDETGDEGVHAAAAVAVGFVGGLEDRGVVEGFVAAHPVAEGVADEDLFDAFALGKLADHIEGIGDRTVEIGIAGVDDFAGGIDGFASFDLAVETDVVIHLEREDRGDPFSGGNSSSRFRG